MREGGPSPGREGGNRHNPPLPKPLSRLGCGDREGRKERKTDKKMRGSGAFFGWWWCLTKRERSRTGGAVSSFQVVQEGEKHACYSKTERKRAFLDRRAPSEAPGEPSSEASLLTQVKTTRKKKPTPAAEDKSRLKTIEPGIKR